MKLSDLYGTVTKTIQKKRGPRAKAKNNTALVDPNDTEATAELFKEHIAKQQNQIKSQKGTIGTPTSKKRKVGD